VQIRFVVHVQCLFTPNPRKERERMSIPIKYCFLVEACDKPESFAKLHPIMYKNFTGGHFTIFPCTHNPPCRDLTDSECDDLQRRFKEKPKEQPNAR